MGVELYAGAATGPSVDLPMEPRGWNCMQALPLGPSVLLPLWPRNVCGVHRHGGTAYGRCQ
eukprot:1427122-Pyramimonas_sp.AAC.1